MTSSQSSSHTRRSRRGPIVLGATIALTGLALGSPQQAASASSRGSASPYNWPVKPFDQAHPVRANFGDPRTTFHGPATLRGLLTAPGSFTFHFGIDIAVPEGTAVYAVRSGTARLLSGRTVQVTSSDEFATQYWHIIPSVKPGQHVTAYQTVLGRTMKGLEHVHFTELNRRVAVNPLAAGHLSPYADSTRPQITSFSFRWSDAGRDVPPEFVHGRVHLIVGACDKPTMQVEGIWRNLPVAPARLSWSIERARDGREVLPAQTAFDVRETLPDTLSFWRFYARGTRQNMATFGTHRFWQSPGVYLYKLTRTPFDTRRLTNGIYTLVVTASDIRGNATTARQVFTVLN